MAGQAISELAYDDFVCIQGPSAYRKRFAVGLITIITIIFVAGLTMFLYRYRHLALPCWYGKAGKYIALYNVSDTGSDEAVTIKGEHRSAIVKRMSNGLPEPVAV